MKRLKIKTFDKIYFFKDSYKNCFENRINEVEQNYRNLFFVSIICKDITALQLFVCSMSFNDHLIKAEVFIDKNDYYQKQEDYNRAIFSIEDTLRTNMFR